MSDHGSNAACPACGWSASKQKCCSYSSHVALFYGAGDRGVWSIGSDLILKEQPNVPPKTEVSNIEFVKHHTTIPVPSVLKEWVDDSNRYFVLMDRIKGQTLEEAWATLSGPQKEHIAKQVAEYMKQLRRLQSSAMQSLNGGPLYSTWLFIDPKENPYGPLQSDMELQDSLAPALEELPPVVSAQLRARLPVCTPYTFTHGDLNCQNIIAKDGELAGILDWESAGYFPVRWEYAATSIGLSAEDAEWKALLRSGEASIDYPVTLTWMKVANPYSRVCLKKGEPVARYCPGNEQEMYLHEYDAQVQAAISNHATKLVLMLKSTTEPLAIQPISV